MKLKTKILSLVALASFSLPVHGQLVFELVEEFTQDWSRTQSQTIGISGTAVQESLSGTTTFDLLLPQYSGTKGDLAKVVILIENSFFSWNTTTALASGSEIFNEVEVSAGTDATLIAPSPAIINFVGLGTTNSPVVGSDNDLKTNHTVTTVGADTSALISGSINSTIYDSEIATGNADNVDSTERNNLDLLFTGSGDVEVEVNSTRTFRIDRDNQGAFVETLFSGSDTGTVRVQYYVTVPEVSAASASSFFGLFLVSGYFLRRRRG